MKPISIYTQITLFGEKEYVAYYKGGKTKIFDHYPSNEELELND